MSEHRLSMFTQSIEEHLPDAFAQAYSGLSNHPTLYDARALSKEIAKRLFEIYKNDEKNEASFCIASTQRTLLLAAVFASMRTGIKAVFPNNMTLDTVKRACEWTDSKALLSDTPLETPESLVNIVGSMIELSINDETAPSCFDLNAPIVSLFTGGSTGSPQLWNKSALNLFGEALYLRETFGISNRDIIVSAATPIHIYGLLFSLLLPFLSGAFVMQRTPLYAQEIIRSIIENNATVLVGAPVHYDALVESESLESLKSQNRLRLAFSSSAPLSPKTSEVFYERVGIGITEIFGSTETGGIALRNRQDRHGEAWQSFSCLAIQEKEKRLAIKSPFLSQELPLENDGTYLSNDRVKIRETGRFDVLGRGDGVIKIGGKRIDRYEIEEAIRSLEGVLDAWVFLLDGRGEKRQRLGALVVAEDLTAQAIQQTIRRKCGALKTPRLIKIVAELPKNALGKRDASRALEILQEK